jgi:hypothetical protein
MDDTGVSAEYLRMLGCHGGHQCLLQTLYHATWASLCFHATATSMLNASFKGVCNGLWVPQLLSLPVQHSTCQWLWNFTTEQKQHEASKWWPLTKIIKKSQ